MWVLANYFLTFCWTATDTHLTRLGLGLKAFARFPLDTEPMLGYGHRAVPWLI